MYQSALPSVARAAIWFAAFFVASVALFDALPVAAQDRGQGLLLLLQSRQQRAALEQALPSLEEQGCSVWRRGSVAGTQGDLDIGSPDSFALLSCVSEILGSVRHRALLSPILTDGTAAMAVEGPILFRDADTAEPAAEAGRAYVLKISRYSNLDPDGRDRDLHRINASASERADTWKTEAFVAGARAFGMPTPDEVVVIYYDSPEQGERFRERNPDILRQIGAFNSTHLIDFTYVSAATGG